MKASGTGKGTMTVVTVYNAKVPEKENKCDNFDLKVDVEDVKMGESPSVPHVSSSCSHWPLPTSPPCPLMSPSTSLMSPVFPCPPYILLHVPRPSRSPCPLQVPLGPFIPLHCPPGFLPCPPRVAAVSLCPLTGKEPEGIIRSVKITICTRWDAMGTSEMLGTAGTSETGRGTGLLGTGPPGTRDREVASSRSPAGTWTTWMPPCPSSTSPCSRASPRTCRT